MSATTMGALFDNQVIVKRYCVFCGIRYERGIHEKGLESWWYECDFAHYLQNGYFR